MGRATRLDLDMERRVVGVFPNGIQLINGMHLSGIG